MFEQDIHRRTHELTDYTLVVETHFQALVVVVVTRWRPHPPGRRPLRGGARESNPSAPPIITMDNRILADVCYEPIGERIENAKIAKGGQV